MPHYPKTTAALDIAYIADLLAELEKLARQRRWLLLAFLIGMAKLQAQSHVKPG